MAFRVRSSTSLLDQDPEDIKIKMRTTTLDQLIGDRSIFAPSLEDQEINTLVFKLQMSTAFKEWSEIRASDDIVSFVAEMTVGVSEETMKEHAILCANIFNIDDVLNPVRLRCVKSLEIEDLVDQMTTYELVRLWHMYDCQAILEAKLIQNYRMNEL